MLLALDTSTPWVSVALFGDEVIHEARSDQALRHGENVMPMVAAAVASVGAETFDITAIAVGVGPGAYTGLRVGLVTARTLGLVWSIPVYGACSLDVLGSESVGLFDEPFVATIDARRKELFWRTYEADGTPIGAEQVTGPGELPPGPVTGAGPELYPEVIDDAGGPRLPSAGWLARAVAEELVDLRDPEPIYLRRPDARVPGPPRRVR